jgi:hypothetical protein
MYSNDKLRLYIIAFLSFCVLSSKHILIYNEETLVALSFFCFLFFVYRYFGNSIKDSLNERSQSIQFELQNFVILKQSSLQELLQEHQKVSELVKAMKNINLFTKRELTGLKVHGGKALKNSFLEQLQQKFKNLDFFNSLALQKLQLLISEKLFLSFFLSFKKKKQKKTKSGNLSIPLQLQKKSVKKALHLLAVNARS